MRAVYRLLIGAAMCGPLALGCAAHGGNEESAESTADVVPEIVLAELVLEDGATVTFYEEDEGSVGVLSRVPAHAELPEVLRQRLGALELYAALSDETPPQALLDAVQRQQAIAEFYAIAEEAEAAANVDHQVTPEDKADPNAPPAFGDGPGLVAHDGNHTSVQFRAEFCPFWSDPNYTDCQTSVTCDGSCTIYEKRSNGVIAIVNPYRGDVRLKIDHTNTWGNYKSIYDVSVLEGETVMKADNISWKRYQRVRITNAAGDGYHRNVEANW